MSLHYNAGQYQQAFEPRKLQNWQKSNPRKKRPNTHEGFTQIISNNRGHLLPSMPRSARSPWGTFTGTWDLPTKIPGPKVTDPTARSPEYTYKNLAMKGEADVIIQGMNKLRRAKCGQPVQAMLNTDQAAGPDAAPEPQRQPTPPRDPTPLRQATPQRHATPPILGYEAVQSPNAPVSPMMRATPLQMSNNATGYPGSPTQRVVLTPNKANTPLPQIASSRHGYTYPQDIQEPAVLQ